MLILTQARAADARALVGAAALGSLVGLAIGGAYLAGGLARSATGSEDVGRFAAAPTAVMRPGGADQARMVVPATYIARAQSAPTTFSARPVRVALPTAAQPFHLRGALEEGRDLECLTQAIYYESRGEGAAGEAAVAQVILNRVRHPAFPKTICGVVFQGVAEGTCQFSFACDGSADRRVDTAAWRQAERVASKALDGFVMARVGNATHFHVARLSPVWSAGLTKIAQIGAHIFYKFGGHKGAAASFTETAELSADLPTALPAPTTNKPVYASLALSLPAPSQAAPAESPAPAPVKAATQEAKPAPAPAAATAAQAKPEEPAKPANPQA